MDDGWVSWVLLSGANSLVREKKDINTDKQVQSQTQAVPTAGAPGVMQEILPNSTPKFSRERGHLIVLAKESLAERCRFSPVLRDGWGRCTGVLLGVTRTSLEGSFPAPSWICHPHCL